MRLAIEFFRVNAILHQHKFDVRDLQASFLLDFAVQRLDASLAPFDLAAGNAPEVGPLCVRTISTCLAAL